jgi:DNA processing protein
MRAPSPCAFPTACSERRTWGHAVSDVRYWIGFNRIPGIGPSRLAALREYFGDIEAAWHASAASLRAVGLPQDVLERLLYFRQRMDLEAELCRVEALGARVLTWESGDYPPLLRQIDAPPPLLYVRGELLPTDEWAVAIVGTRHATVYGKEVQRWMLAGAPSPCWPPA